MKLLFVLLAALVAASSTAPHIVIGRSVIEAIRNARAVLPATFHTAEDTPQAIEAPSVPEASEDVQTPAAEEAHAAEETTAVDAAPAHETVPAEAEEPVAEASVADSHVQAEAIQSVHNSAFEASPAFELQQAASVSAAQVEQSLAVAAVPVATAILPTVVPILMDERDPIVGNAFGFRFQSGDGQFRSEKSSIKPLPVGAVAVPNSLPEYETVGEYSFTHPDGTVHRVTYTAGANGYVAVGDMLPTPPPMPYWAVEQIRFAEEQKRLQSLAASAPAETAAAAAAESDILTGESRAATEELTAPAEESSPAEETAATSA